MYDNVDFKLRSSEAMGIDFLNETPHYFDVSGEHYFNGEQVLSGYLDGLKIVVSASGVNITNGSICKWYLGDNFKTMHRSDTRMAIEKLSDTLHLPIEKATVSRIDVAQNFIVRYEPEVYFNHLGNCYPLKRLEQPNGLYYQSSTGTLIFYNKVKEQSDKRNQIPVLYTNRFLLRYEQRYTKRIAKSFKVERVTGKMLYDEAFYMGIIDRWKESYSKINKINDTQFNFERMKTKRDLYTNAVLSLVANNGGEVAFLQQIAEAQKKGELSRKQAFDLRQVVTDASRQIGCEVVKSDVITELDKKINEAVRFYR